MKDHHYDIDQLRESMVKILHDDEKGIAGSGFIIRSDGYLITCHHVIYRLDSLKVEYQGNIYEAQWCEELSEPEVDIAILKIDVEDAKAVPIVELLQELPTSVTVCGYPQSRMAQFPKGRSVSAEKIQKSDYINIISTYPTCEIKFTNPWNKLPKDESTFLSHRIDAKVEQGTSGGPVFAQELGGVVGVIQCSKSNESYVIRWDNIKDKLHKLGLEPWKDAVCQFLEEIEEEFKYMEFLHAPEEKIVLKDQYIPIEVTLERKYRHEVETSWGYAKSEEELKRAYALKGMDEESQQPSQVPWEGAKKQNQRTMVLADPGMGKSTLLKMEALSTARGERQQLLDNEKNVDDVIFPIALTLSELNEREEEIFDAIPSLITRNYPKTSGGIIHLLKKKLNEGKCLLLLDALDEVPKESRNNLSDKLNRFARNYPCPIICTSRIVGYVSAFVADAKEVEIVPFSQKQIEQYVQTWFKNASGFINDDSVSADRLLRELRNKFQIRGLTQNPLLLSLLCSLYQEEELTLPARRCQIYEKAVDYMLSKWRQNTNPQSEWRIIAKMELLGELAYHFTCEGLEIFSSRNLYEKIVEYLRSESVSPEFKDSRPSDLITELSESDGIIQKLEREGEKYIFLHRTFQEYLTASYLNNQPDCIDLARKHFWDYDWHETLSLLAGLMKDPIPLLKAITDEKDDIFSNLLLLAGRCIVECEENYHSLIADIINRIYRLWYHISPDFIESTVVALGQVNSQMLGRLQNETLNDVDEFIRRAAVYTLGEIGNGQAAESLIQALNDIKYVRRAATSALGEIDNPQAVDVLIQALKDKDNLYEVVKALGEIGSPKAVEPLIQVLNDEESWIGEREAAAEALGAIGNEQAVEPLIQALKDEEHWVRATAASALGEIGNEQAVEPLIQALKDKRVKKEAAEALGKIGSEQAIEILIQTLEDKDKDIRGIAALALGDIGSQQTVDLLIQVLNCKDSNIRKYAVWALGRIGGEQAIDALIRALNNEENWVREAAAKALGRIGNEQVVEQLIQALEDEDKGVRWNAVLALDWIGSEQAVDALIQALKDKESLVREYSALALGEIGSEQAVEPLIQALNDERVRREAVEALGRIGSEQAIDVLIQALNNPNRFFRRWTAEALGKTEALGKIGSKQAVDALIQALKDEDGDVRWNAAKALEKIGTLETLEKLIQSSEIDIYDPDIFSLARTLAIRFSKEKTPFIPVYPELIVKRKT